MNDLTEHKQMMTEWESWQQVIKSFCQTFHITKEQFNENKYKLLVEKIKEWSEEYARLRIYQLKIGKDYLKEKE